MFEVGSDCLYYDLAWLSCMMRAMIQLHILQIRGGKDNLEDYGLGCLRYCSGVDLFFMPGKGDGLYDLCISYKYGSESQQSLAFIEMNFGKYMCDVYGMDAEYIYESRDGGYREVYRWEGLGIDRIRALYVHLYILLNWRIDYIKSYVYSEIASDDLVNTVVWDMICEELAGYNMGCRVNTQNNCIRVYVNGLEGVGVVERFLLRYVDKEDFVVRDEGENGGVYKYCIELGGDEKRYVGVLYRFGYSLKFI